MEKKPFIEGKKKSASVIRGIFTCSELERKVVKSSKSSRKVANLKQIDSAVMQFSSNNNVTRYAKAELMTLKETKAAQAAPICQHDPRIIRLDILSSQIQSEKTEKQLQEFRALLPNITMENLDPNLVNLLETYHKSLLNPPDSFPTQSSSYQHSPVKGNSPNFNRRVSWGDQKIPSYDRKNFYDSITTTTTMRPPRMGIGSLDSQKTRSAQPNVRSAKGFACSNERFNYNPNNLSAGNASLNETKSSYEGSVDKEHSKSTSKDDGNESEPEWFSWPASRHDVIDLHGFDEEDELQQLEPSARSSDVGTEVKSDRVSPLKMFDEFASYEQRHEMPGMSSSNRRANNYRLNRNQTNNNFNGGVNGQRYRHPLQQSDSSSSTMNSSSSGSHSDAQRFFGHDQYASGREAMAINPFFEMWKIKNAQQENVNFLNLMNPSRTPMKTISDIESGMRQNTNPYDFYYGQQQQQQQQFAAAMNRPINGQSVPQFFQKANEAYNAAGGGNFSNPFLMPTGAGTSGNRSGYFDNVNGPTGFMMPSHEQLEQHTSEIMRNAILRKQSQSERKFRK